MKKILFAFAIGLFTLGSLSSCEKKSKAEKLMEDVGEGVEEAADDVKEGIEEAADEAEEEGSKGKKKLKDLIKKD